MIKFFILLAYCLLVSLNISSNDFKEIHYYDFPVYQEVEGYVFENISQIYYTSNDNVFMDSTIINLETDDSLTLSLKFDKDVRNKISESIKKFYLFEKGLVNKKKLCIIETFITFSGFAKGDDSVVVVINAERIENKETEKKICWYIFNVYDSKNNKIFSYSIISDNISLLESVISDEGEILKKAKDDLSNGVENNSVKESSETNV